MRNILFFFFLFIPFSVFSQIKLDSGLVAYYPFTGDANDVSGNANNPIFNNATLTADKTGTPNSAYHFDGSTMYMRIPNSATLNLTNQISLCAIVKVDDFYSGPCHGNDIINKNQYGGHANSYFMRFDDFAYTNGMNCSIVSVDEGHQNFYGWGTAISPGYTPYIQTNQWYCLVYTYDGTTAKFYVGGTLKSQSVVSLNFSNTNDVFLGRLYDPSDPSSFPYWFNGTMDEIRIYNRAINDPEVASLCNLFSLPIALSDFSANIIDKEIKLKWHIENEEGVGSFTVERSISGHSDFVPLETVAAANAHSYSYIDNKVAVNQDYYYRLAMHEISGAVNYSEIKTARISRKNALITIFPNPSKGNVVLRISGFQGQAKFTVINSVGQVVLESNKVITANSSLMLDLSKKSKGVYWLKVETSHQRLIQRIVLF